MGRIFVIAVQPAQPLACGFLHTPVSGYRPVLVLFVDDFYSRVCFGELIQYSGGIGFGATVEFADTPAELGETLDPSGPSPPSP